MGLTAAGVAFAGPGTLSVVDALGLLSLAGGWWGVMGLGVGIIGALRRSCRARRQRGGSRPERLGTRRGAFTGR